MLWLQVEEIQHCSFSGIACKFKFTYPTSQTMGA